MIKFHARIITDESSDHLIRIIIHMYGCDGLKQFAIARPQIKRKLAILDSYEIADVGVLSIVLTG